MQRLIICGGGHVSLEVAIIAARLDFEITVIDDREEFANRERFPMVKQVLCMPFQEALKRLGSRTSDFYVILTRGHAFDQECLADVLRGSYAYVGMIGSKTKVKTVRTNLMDIGFSESQLDAVHAPIGLNLGGQSPAEIAVSICAQLIQVRSALGPDILSPPDAPGVLCTIVKKTGSAPRGVGTWMLVRPDGSCEGTIGGGSVEYKAILDAQELWNGTQNSAHHVYDLTAGAADLGMVCGGMIEVDFTVKRN